MTGAQDLTALSQKPIADVLTTLDTSGKGLSPQEASKRLKQYGPNEFAGKKKLQPALIFLSKFKNPLLLLLIAAALISFFLGSQIEAIVNSSAAEKFTSRSEIFDQGNLTMRLSDTRSPN